MLLVDIGCGCDRGLRRRVDDPHCRRSFAVTWSLDAEESELSTKKEGVGWEMPLNRCGVDNAATPEGNSRRSNSCARFAVAGEAGENSRGSTWLVRGAAELSLAVCRGGGRPRVRAGDGKIPPAEDRAKLEDELRGLEVISRWRIAVGDRLCRRGDRFRTRTGGGDRKGRIKLFDHPTPSLSAFFVDLVEERIRREEEVGRKEVRGSGSDEATA